MANQTRKTIDLSPEARAVLAHALPLEVEHDQVYLWRRMEMPVYDVRREIVAFIAALVNEALAPAAPVVVIEWEAAEQPVPMCAEVDCLNAADPTTPGGAYCIACDVTGRALPRWTGEQMIAREG